MTNAAIAPEAIDEFLKKLTLQKGGHRPDGEFCFMEAVAYVAGEQWSDSPQCASRVIAAYMRRLNDSWSDADRQTLKPYIVKLVGTAASEDVERRRAYMAGDWCTRVAVPKAFRAAGWTEEAEHLEQLLEVVNQETSRAAGVALHSAAEVARKFRSERRAQLEAKLRNLLVGDAGDAGAAGAAGAAWAAWDAWAAGAAGDAWDAWAAWAAWDAWAAGDAWAAWDAWAAGAAWAAWDAWAAWAALPDKILAAIKAKKPSQSVYDVTYSLVYKEMRPRYDELLKSLNTELHASAIDLLERMLACQEVAA